MKTELRSWFQHLFNHARQILKGHPLVCFSVVLTLAFATVTIRVLAQQSAAAPTTEALEIAVALYEQGEYRQAQSFFSAIETNSPDYAAALAYDALCRYEICRADATNGYRWFLDTLKSPVLQQAELPTALREVLTFDQIDARYQSRPFGFAEIIPLAASFRQDHPTSPRLGAVSEYELAAWFERGMQRLYSASTDEPKRFYKTWTNGVAHLDQFLSLARASRMTDYAVLNDRSLIEDLQIATAMLNGNPSALTNMVIRDPASRERYTLMLLGLHQKLRPEEWEQNLQAVADFAAQVNAMPASRERARMKRQLARFGFRTGERFCFEAAGTPPTNRQTITAKRAVASRYFQSARAVQGQMAKRDWSDTSPTDTALLWADLFNSYYFERDYAGLMAATTAQLTNSAPGKPKWLATKIYQGVALYHQNPPQPDAAAAAFDEVMSYGLDASRKRATQDHLLLFAARWRIRLALKADDPATALNIVQWAEQANGDAELKEKFLNDHRWVAKWAATKRS